MSLTRVAKRLKGGLKAAIPRACVVRTLRPAGPPSLLLTFDDGPDPRFTPGVLDRLDRAGAKGVFFLVGRRVKRAPGLAREILDRGHRIGNHSHLHRRSYVKGGGQQVGLGAYLRDLERCQARIEAATGRPPDLFRPPGGRLVPKTLIAPRLLGLRTVNWSLEVRDWSFRGEEEARLGARTLVEAARGGDILLLHDDHPWILPLLDDLLPGLAGRGFDLAPAPDRV